MGADELALVAPLGTALPVVFQVADNIERPGVGVWVKLRNLGARVVQGQLQVRPPALRPPPGRLPGHQMRGVISWSARGGRRPLPRRATFTAKASGRPGRRTPS